MSGSSSWLGNLQWTHECLMWDSKDIFFGFLWTQTSTAWTSRENHVFTSRSRLLSMDSTERRTQAGRISYALPFVRKLESLRCDMYKKPYTLYCWQWSPSINEPAGGGLSQLSELIFIGSTASSPWKCDQATSHINISANPGYSTCVCPCRKEAYFSCPSVSRERDLTRSLSWPLPLVYSPLPWHTTTRTCQLCCFVSTPRLGSMNMVLAAQRTLLPLHNLMSVRHPWVPVSFRNGNVQKNHRNWRGQSQPGLPRWHPAWLNGSSWQTCHTDLSRCTQSKLDENILTRNLTSSQL